MTRLRQIPDGVIRGIAARIARSTPRRPRLDWREYYIQFEQRHGGDPVLYDNTILFRDGWRYSATDHAGPEYPPPESKEELRHLQLVYWDTRRQELRLVHHQLAVRANGLRSLQTMKDGPLMQVTVGPDDEGKPQAFRGPVNLEDIEADAEATLREMNVCIEHIEELRREPNAS